MRWFPLAVAAVAVPVVALSFLAAPAAHTAPEPDWSKHTGGLPFVVGLERGREEAKFTGLPMMLFFSSLTDADSAFFGAGVWKDADVRTKVAGWTPVVVDWDKADPEFRKKCRADCVPTVTWFDHDEKWIWACIGNAPLPTFREEAEKARRACPKAKEPAAEMKLLPDLVKKLDEAAAAKDVKAQIAAVTEIQKIRLGEAYQVRARAADEQITKDGLAAIERITPVFADKKATTAKKTEAKAALQKIADDHGADHAVGKAALAAIEAASGKPKPKK